MPTIVALLVLFLSCVGTSAAADNCAVSGSPAWSTEVHNIIAGCESRLASPDGSKVLLVKADGRLSLSYTHGTSFDATSFVVGPPAMVSWAPSSSVFFVNDGEGSGMASTFRLFRLVDSRVTEVNAIQRNAVKLYRDQMACPASAADPNVWGIGWSSTGKEVYLFVQATANMPCGKPSEFMGLVVNSADGSVIEQLATAKAKRRFRALLPREVYNR